MPLGAVGGSLLAREVNKRLGLEEPGLFGDVVAGAGPLLPYAGDAGRALLRQSRAGRALRDAQTAHAAQVATALRESVEATQKAQHVYAEQGWQAYQTALAEAKQKQAQYRQAVADYQAAIQAHQEAITTARALPGRYAPPAPLG
jgi:hypothetical protein